MPLRYGWLTPPSKPVFIISVVLAGLAVLVWLGFIAIPIINQHLFQTLLIAYGVLLAGNLFRGI